MDLINMSKIDFLGLEIETPVLYFKLVIALSFGMTIEYGIHMPQFVYYQ